MSNGLPAWDWESFFPNPGNNFTVTEQNITIEVPLEPTWRGLAERVGEPGITVFGIVMAPGNVQRATCEDGTELNIEAFNNSDVSANLLTHACDFVNYAATPQMLSFLINRRHSTALS